MIALGLYARALLGESWFLDVFITEVWPHALAVQRSLDQGTLPFWVPELMFGYPLAFNPQVGALYPPHLALFLVFDAETALVVSAVLHTALAGLGGVALARRLGATELGAAVAGACLAASPFLAFYHQALHGLVALAWFPWMVWFSVELRERWAWPSFCGLAVTTALALYGGHVQLVLLAGLAAVLPLGGARRDSPGPGDDRQPGRGLYPAMLGVLRVGAAGLVGVLLYGPQLLAARALLAESLRRQLSPHDVVAALEVETYGADDLLEVLLPNAFGGPSLRDFWYPEYLGPALGLALLGVLASGTLGRAGRRLAGVGLAALVLVHVPWLNELLLSVPGLAMFRAPGRFVIFVWLGVALLAAAGADAPGRTKTGLAIAVLGLAALLGAFDALPLRDPEVPLPALSDARRVDALLLLFGGLALAGAHRLRAAPHALVFLAVAVPLVVVALRYAPTVHARREPPAATWLRGVPHQRVLGVGAGFEHYLAAVPGGSGWPHGSGRPERAAETLMPDTQLAYGFAGIHAQTSLPLQRVVQRLYGANLAVLAYPPKQEAPWTAEALAALGVSHVVAARTGQLPVSPRPAPVFERDGVVVYAIPGARGLARRGTRDLEVTRSAEAIQVALDGTPGIVSIQEAWFPGWTAEVDGVGAPVVIEDGAFMGVEVGAGSRSLRLTFDPAPFRLGVWFTGGGLGVLLATWALTRRRRLQRSES